MPRMFLVEHGGDQQSGTHCQQDDTCRKGETKDEVHVVAAVSEQAWKNWLHKQTACVAFQ
ncbi:MAG UNVERIFIED_CONTAM: hypothetical protein LVT10_03305 [Anaerolineae bacterium]